jgi:CRP-like cAMP-binding protein
VVALSLLGRGRFSRAMGAGAALIAVPLAILAAAAHPLVAIAGFAILGIGYAMIDTAGQTLVQRLASDEGLARAVGVAETASAAAVTLGSMLAPLLIALLGSRSALVATALLVPAAVLARRRALLALDAKAVVPERELQALRTVDVFAPLPIATVETLALRSLPRVVFADENVLLPGDVSTRFYVIAQGTFEVQAGPVVRQLEPGDYFGEIALLRDVPRTAAVIAQTDGLLYVLAREDFLNAVTGHVRSTQTAERVAEARLRASATV